MTIRLHFSSLDDYRGKTRSFKTLKGARKAAQHRLGQYAECGMSYAISGDGVCKVEIYAGDIRLEDLFGPDPVAKAVRPEYSVKHEKLNDGEWYFRVYYGETVYGTYDERNEAIAHMEMAKQYDAEMEEERAEEARYPAYAPPRHQQEIRAYDPAMPRMMAYGCWDNGDEMPF